MQDVLRRCNSIGNREGIFHLAKVAFVQHETSIKTVTDMCSFINDIRISCVPAIYLFEYLGYIQLQNGIIIASDEAIQLAGLNIHDFGINISKKCLKKMLADEMIKLDTIHFEYIKNQYYISRSGFPLYAAVFRNLLVEFGTMVEVATGDFYVDASYEILLERQVSEVKRAVTLEELKKKLENQQRQGELAELFVVEFENKRLFRKPQQRSVKKISEVDVTAGYDVVSFDLPLDEQYSRFIEVKSYRGTPHFYWSRNEKHVAEQLKDKYYIYLVDVDNIGKEGYEPIIISNPVSSLMEECTWIIETESYLIKNIS